MVPTSFLSVTIWIALIGDSRWNFCLALLIKSVRGSLLPLIKFEAGFEFLLYEDTELKNLTSVIVAESGIVIIDEDWLL